MFLLSREDELHESLKALALEIQFLFDDMAPAQDTPGVFRLPGLPTTAAKLAKAFYDGKKEWLYRWARSKGLCIVRRASFGPRVVFVKPGGILSVSARQISFSIVVPNPSGEPTKGPELPSDIAQGSGNATANTPFPFQSGYASISIFSPVTKALVTQSSRDVEVGDIIILEEDERLSALNSKGICLVSVLHVTKCVEAGQGGWIEATVGGEKGTQPVA